MATQEKLDKIIVTITREARRSLDELRVEMFRAGVTEDVPTQKAGLQFAIERTLEALAKERTPQTPEPARG